MFVLMNMIKVMIPLLSDTYIQRNITTNNVLRLLYPVQQGDK